MRSFGVCMCSCVHVCVGGIPKTHCALIWVLNTLLTPCDDWQAFCPIERPHSDPLLWLQFGFGIAFCGPWNLVWDWTLLRCHWMFATVHPWTRTCTQTLTDVDMDAHTQTLTHLWSLHTPVEPSSFPTVRSCQALWLFVNACASLTVALSAVKAMQ